MLRGPEKKTNKGKGGPLKQKELRKPGQKPFKNPALGTVPEKNGYGGVSGSGGNPRGRLAIYSGGKRRGGA